jgi:hypothetical protein
MKKKLIICSFFNKCKNFEKECHHCKWNASCNLGDFLSLETSNGKTIRYLETR